MVRESIGFPLWSILTVTHLIGLVLGVGSATVKLVLLLKCRADPTFVFAYSKIVRLITRLIILGLIMLTASGIGWVVLGYPFKGQLIVKVILVITIWVLGPVIDNVIEPKFRKLAPVAGEAPQPEFLQIQRWYLALEFIATGLFYIIIVFWVFR